MLLLAVILLTGFGVATTHVFLLFQEKRGVFSYLSQSSSQRKGEVFSVGWKNPEVVRHDVVKDLHFLRVFSYFSQPSYQRKERSFFSHRIEESCSN